MICPRCETEHDILQYVPMEQIEAYAEETNPVYRCPTCRWVFSPAPHVLEVFR
jgi:rubredoxin